MPSRREFLRWCSGVPALWLPASFTAAPLVVGQEPNPQQQRTLSTPLDYRLTPRYPAGAPLDDVRSLRVMNSAFARDRIEFTIAGRGSAMEFTKSLNFDEQ